MKGSRDLALGANSISVGATNLSSSYSGILSGTGGLAKQGTGTLALSGPNTYEGATTVSAGSLVFQNTAAKPPLSAVSVAAGATLGLGVGTAPDLLHGHRDRGTVRQHPRRRHHGPRLQCRHRHHGGRLHLRLQPRRRCHKASPSSEPTHSHSPAPMPTPAPLPSTRAHCKSAPRIILAMPRSPPTPSPSARQPCAPPQTPTISGRTAPSPSPARPPFKWMPGR